MKYKYYTFSSLPKKDKKFIVMCFRGLLKVFKAQWDIKSKTLNTTISPIKFDFGLPQEAYDQFQQICKRKGQSFSEVEATKEANNLINLFRVLG